MFSTYNANKNEIVNFTEKYELLDNQNQTIRTRNNLQSRKKKCYGDLCLTEIHLDGPQFNLESGRNILEIDYWKL